MELTEKKVVEVKEEEIKAVEEAQAPQVKVAIVIGMQTDGQLFFNAEGQADLIVLEGLLAYGKKQLDKMWSVALAPKEAPVAPVDEAK